MTVSPGDGSWLHAAIVVQRASFALDIQLRISPGEVVALLGPNGAGKTTALRCLAGLTPLSAGRISWDGHVVEDPVRGVRLRPEHRDVGVVFQDYLLFPHMTALDNVAFGLRRRGLSKRAARTAAEAQLATLGLADRARVKPRQLSGGQAQRVALARALATKPSLLLLDEPLAALDAKTRLDTRTELHRRLADYPGATLLVTHDPLDALVLADRLMIVEDGQVVQEGDGAAITAQPRTEYVAQLVGLNLFRGRGQDSEVTIASDRGKVVMATVDTVDGDAFVCFPPSAVAIHLDRPNGSPRNVWPATIDSIQRHGDNLRVILTGAISVAADISCSSVVGLGLTPGDSVWAAVKAAATHAYPA